MASIIPSPATPAAPAGGDGAHDFDFLFGSWRVMNRRRHKRLTGCHEWETFEANLKVWPILEGRGNMDEFRPRDWNPGYIGMSLRLFNPATRRWSISWMDNRSVTLEPAVVGAWLGDTGIFTGPDLFAGRPIIVRFTWQLLGPDAARWAQEFSADRGETWEKNWIMEFTRDEK